MWSYWRSRLSLQACCGIAVTSRTGACKRRARSAAELSRVERQKIGDAVDLNVRRRSGLWFGGVVTLTDVDRGRPRSEPRLGSGKERGLVVNVDVVARREAALDLGQVILLVFVDENVAARGEEQSGARDLGRLIDAVAVRDDRDFSERPEPRDHVDRARIQVSLEGHVQDRAIDIFGPRIVREGAAEPTKRLREVHDARLLA